MEQKTLIFLVIISLVISSGSLIVNTFYIDNIDLSKSYIDDEIIKNNISYVMPLNCSSKDLLYSAYCLRKELLTFYKYNLTNTGKILSLDELKDIGGVCSHYSNWYKMNMKEMGFYAETMVVNTQNLSHEVAVAWDSEYRHMCILDQWKVICQ